MNILFVSAVVPYPLHSGGQIRIYQLLRRLSEMHAIHLLCFMRDRSEEQYAGHLAFCKSVDLVYRGRAWSPRNVLRSVFGSHPLLTVSYDIPGMRSRIERVSRSGHIDIVHLEPGYVWQSLPDALRGHERSSRPRLVVAEHNIEHTVYREYTARTPWIPLRPGMYLDTVKLAYWERRIWKRADRIITVSASDRDMVLGTAPGCPVDVIPNGVDIGEFSFSSPRAILRAPRFLFVGDYNWLPNKEAVHSLLGRIWPVMKQAFPDATLLLVGGHIPRVGGAGVTVATDVPDIRTAYRRADILLAPMGISGGTKFKILEAMAMGVPVITTEEGIRGLTVSDGVEVLVAGNAAGFVESVRGLLNNRRYAAVLTKAARDRVERSYNWDALALMLERTWNTCL
ncbi:glycosyltransferase family 4 protein [Patescibacteria group bacterium]|nr:glycosyltransferase family 4 protein [Patescibacteria group bacterium]